MKAIITRANDNGTFSQVGTSNRTVATLKTATGIRNRAAAYANGKAYIIEFFTEESFYRDEPFRVEEVNPCDVS